MYEDWVYADEASVAAPQATLERVRIASTFLQRCVGLLATKSLAPDEGLMFVPGGSIHTCGMRYPIDVVFLSEHLDVLENSCWSWRAVRVSARAFARASSSTLSPNVNSR
jgi:hypothetical protein